MNIPKFLDVEDNEPFMTNWLKIIIGASIMNLNLIMFNGIFGIISDWDYLRGFLGVCGFGYVFWKMYRIIKHEKQNNSSERQDR